VVGGGGSGRPGWYVLAHPLPGRVLRSENIGAADVELTADDLREIEDAASKITVQGARYPEHLERLTGR
jgi:hypothetical protein